MTHLGLVVVGTLGTVAYVELYRNRRIEESEFLGGSRLFQELNDFLFKDSDGGIPLFEVFELQSLPCVPEPALRVLIQESSLPCVPEPALRVLIQESSLPHYRQIEHRPGGRKSQVRRARVQNR